MGTGGSCVLLALRQDGAIVGAPARGTCCPGFSETPLLGPWLLNWEASVPEVMNFLSANTEKAWGSQVVALDRCF